MNSRALLASLAARDKMRRMDQVSCLYVGVFDSDSVIQGREGRFEKWVCLIPIINSSRLDRRFGITLLRKITLANYGQDPYYTRIVKATEDLLRERGFVAPIELFIRMELLSPESVEDWRRGRIPYLERVIRCNLSKASRILRILRMHAHDLDLKPLLTVYKRWTKGPRTLLQFSKTCDRAVEDAYARHFLSPGKDAHPGRGDRRPVAPRRPDDHAQVLPIE